MDALTHIPDALRAEARRALERLGAVHSGLAEQPPPVLQRLARVVACSPFTARVLARDPSLLALILASQGAPRALELDVYAAALAGEVAAADDEGQLKRCLRRARARAYALIAWRDIAGLAPLVETLESVSRVAEILLQQAAERLFTDLCDRFGEPGDDRGQSQQLVVLAMGKLGARELNFSSDIDLILAHPGDGHTSGARRPLSSHEFFTRLGKALVNTLSEQTEDGFVYRVDLRLRPFGSSGPLVTSLPAFEEYLESHAREWERYALIKARPVAGDLPLGERFLADLQPFVYRRYLDFTALDSLRDMKQMINAEVARHGRDDNIKVGRGGIREIEFIGQSIQLIYGGRHRKLRQRPIVDVLQALQSLGLLPAATVEELGDAYAFLRRLENRLQQVHDQQTHAIPDGEVERARLAFGMDFPDWDSLRSALDDQRDKVAGHFEVLLAPAADDAQRDETLADCVTAWRETVPERAQAILERLGFAPAVEAVASLQALRSSARVQAAGPSARERLDKFVPHLLSALSGRARAQPTLQRLIPLLDNLAQRSVYLALLNERPAALENLLALASASGWLSTQLAHQPALLDELLDARLLRHPAKPEELAAQLEARLAGLAAEDLEGRMDTLRLFKQGQVFRVAAADVVSGLPLAEVSNHLSFTAECVLQGAFDCAWQELTARHGEPAPGDAAADDRAGFAIVAYGKLGGLELGYGSDLDLIFLYQGDAAGGSTGGPRPVDNQVFFTRLGQRIIHYLTTRTGHGRAYEIDTRLRPSGKSGLLVSSLQAFERYQLQEAWTWEHQALTRARSVAGHAAARDRFEDIRRRVLCQPRDAARLRREIQDMRRRMRQELAPSDPACFDLKHSDGGITDIEFLVQYVTLRYAHACPALVDVTDNLRLLDAFNEFDIIDAARCGALYNAYFAYRAEVHRRGLEGESSVVETGAFREHRTAVQQMWAQLEDGTL